MTTTTESSTGGWPEDIATAYVWIKRRVEPFYVVDLAAAIRNNRSYGSARNIAYAILAEALADGLIERAGYNTYRRKT